LYHWDLKVLVTKDSYDYVPANVAKKKLLVLEIVWSVGWYGLWPKINLLKKSFVGSSLWISGNDE
jgi:hypothetical protein